MKKVFLSMAALTVLFFANSCNKCSTCTKSGSPQIKYCQKDYNSKADYDLAVSATEALGYECK